jgi:tetratricopeptide (TPR) repeat protein
MRRQLTWLVFTAICLILAMPVSSQAEKDVCSQAAQASSPEKQIELWTQCLQTDQLDDRSLAAAYSNRGNAKRQAGNLDGAIEDFSQAIDILGDEPRLYYNRALTLGSAERFQEAVEDFSMAIELDADFVSAYFNRGMARYNLGNYQAAAEDFSQVLHLEPNQAKAYAQRAFARKAMGRMKAAREDARIAASLNSSLTVPEFPD